MSHPTDGSMSPLLQHIRSRQARITVIGLGYVGLPLALGLVKAGFTVTGFDGDLSKLESLRKGRDYINGQHEVVQQAVSGGRFIPSAEVECLEQSDVILICVPTPLNRNREPDLTTVTTVSKLISKHLQPGTLVVLESTTYPGTTEEVVMPELLTGGRVHQVGHDFHLAFSPERVDPGNPRFDTENTAKVVGGATPLCGDLAAALYEALLGKPELVKRASGTRAAELEKVFENIFRSVNIALVNELALLCRQMDLDVWEVLELADTKPFGFMRFNPGPGIGGHCIPLDPFYLTWKAREYDFPTRFVELAGEINSRMPHHVVELISEALQTRGLKDATILLVGVAYKRDVSDYRESPAMRLWDLLVQRGAKVSYHDPHVPELSRQDVSHSSVASDALADYDCHVLLTDHSCLDLTALLGSARALVDTRGATRALPVPESCYLIRLGTGGSSNGH